MKHHTRWEFIQNGDDTLTATSPAGHVHTIRPEGRMRPAPPAVIKAAAAAANTTTTEEDDHDDCPF